MKLHSLLNEDLIFLRTPHSDKNSAIQFLLQKIIDKFGLSPRKEELMSLVSSREALGGTTFPSGLAVPHARVPHFSDLILAAAIPAVPFFDGEVKVTMVTLILTSETNPTMYLNSLSSFVKMSAKPETFLRLLGARNSGEFIAVVEEQDYSVKRDILVGDLMSPADFTVTPATPLKTLIDALYQNKFSYMPVLDAEGNFIGEIRLMDVINLGIPDYVKQLGTLKFTSSLEPFEKLLENEYKYTAGDIMRKPEQTLTPKTSLLEASMTFLKTKSRQLAVIDGKRIVGVLSYMDIFNKIFRG